MKLEMTDVVDSLRDKVAEDANRREELEQELTNVQGKLSEVNNLIEEIREEHDGPPLETDSSDDDEGDESGDTEATFEE